MSERKRLFKPNMDDIANEKKLSLPTKEEADVFQSVIEKARKPYESVQNFMAYSHDSILSKVREMRQNGGDRIYLMKGQRDVAAEALEKAIESEKDGEKAQMMLHTMARTVKKGYDA